MVLSSAEFTCIDTQASLQPLPYIIHLSWSMVWIWLDFMLWINYWSKINVGILKNGFEAEFQVNLYIISKRETKKKKGFVTICTCTLEFVFQWIVCIAKCPEIHDWAQKKKRERED